MFNYFSYLSVVSILFAGLAFDADMAIAQQLQPSVTTAPQPFDMSSINGSWKPIKGTLAGRELPDEQLDSIRLTVHNGIYETSGTGFVESGKMVIRIPAADKPQGLDVVIEKGDNAGTTIEGIIRFDEKKLIVCYAISGERPARFESGEADQTLLLEYENVTGFMSMVTPTIIIQEEEEPYQVGVDPGGPGKK